MFTLFGKIKEDEDEGNDKHEEAKYMLGAYVGGVLTTVFGVICCLPIGSFWKKDRKK